MASVLPLDPAGDFAPPAPIDRTAFAPLGTHEQSLEISSPPALNHDLPSAGQSRSGSLQALRGLMVNVLPLHRTMEDRYGPVQRHSKPFVHLT
jgi:hypothetical protein